MKTKFLFILLVLSQIILFASCGSDDDNNDGKYESNGYFMIEADDIQYEYYGSTYGKTGIGISQDGKTGILTMLTLNVKGNRDYRIYTGGSFSILHSLQGSGEYKIVSQLDLASYILQTNEKVLCISSIIGSGSSSKTSYTFNSSSSHPSEKAIVTEKDGKYFIKIEEPVTLDKFLVHGTPNENVPEKVKIRMGTDGILYKENK